jgi:hypothetical protein
MKWDPATCLFGATALLVVACGGEPMAQTSDARVVAEPDQWLPDSAQQSDPISSISDSSISDSSISDSSVPTAGDSGAPDAVATPDSGPSCLPLAEVENCANAVDDDCNGLTDSQDPACQKCEPTSERQDCETKHPGACATGVQRCILEAGGIWAWSRCEPDVEPGSRAEICDNAQDDDCDGKPPSQDPDCYCGNGLRDRDESDVDCGGSCSACTAGHLCVEATDCVSKRCQGPTVSGGCSGFERSTGVYVEGGKLTVGCVSRWSWNDDNPRETRRSIAISGVTFSGGCSGFERSTGVYVEGGKLTVGCVSRWSWNDDNPREIRRPLTVEGASFSGGCSGSERSTGVYVEGGKLMVGCVSRWSWSDDNPREARRSIIITGPSICQ